MDQYQEDVQENTDNKVIDVLKLVAEVSEKLHRENMIDALVDKSESLSFGEKLLFGDKLIKLADEYGANYLSVTT